MQDDTNHLIALFNSGHHQELESYAREVLTQHADFGVAWKVLGASLQVQGKPALSELQRAALLLPADAQVKNILGLALQSGGQPELALASFQAALNIDPQLAGVHINLANTLGGLSRISESIENYRLALALQPNNAETHNSLGVSLLRQGRKLEAIESLSTAIKLRPTYAIALNNLGIALRDIGKIEDAIDCYRRAIDAQPDYAMGHSNLGIALLGLGREAEALVSLRYASSLAKGDLQSQGNFVGINTGIAVALTKIVPNWHVPMMNDTLRNEAYFNALKEVITSDSLVLELGTGSGLLAMMAAKLGARKVVTCEGVSLIADTAKKIISNNGFGDSVSVVPKMSTDLVVGIDIEQRADILVSEIFSSELLGEGVLSSIEDAKRRLLKPDARIIPSVGSVVVALFGGNRISQSIWVDQVQGFDLSAFNQIAAAKQMISRNDHLIELYSDELEVFNFDFENANYFPSEAKVCRLPVTMTGRCYGVIQWIRLKMDAHPIFENHPSVKSATSGWQQCLFRFDQPIDVVAGTAIDINAGHNRLALWFSLA